MNVKIKRAIALLIVAGMPAALMVWFRVRQATEFASVELIVYPLLFGTIGIAVAYALKRYLLGESIGELNRAAGKLSTDLATGFALAVACFALFYLNRFALSGALRSSPNFELLGLMLDMRQHPLLLILWFGPVLWIGIALYEEVLRTFVLSELWSFSDDRRWAFAAILLCALFMGALHWSQGPYGIVTIAMKSALIGTFYYYVRRLFPLVLAHVLYDGIQVGMLLITYPAD